MNKHFVFFGQTRESIEPNNNIFILPFRMEFHLEGIWLRPWHGISPPFLNTLLPFCIQQCCRHLAAVPPTKGVVRETEKSWAPAAKSTRRRRRTVKRKKKRVSVSFYFRRSWENPLPFFPILLFIHSGTKWWWPTLLRNWLINERFEPKSDSTL